MQNVLFELEAREPKESLKDALLFCITICRPHMLTLKDLEEVCKFKGRKMSNGERRLRELADAELIEMVRNEKKAIIGYKLKQQVAMPKIERKNETVEQGALFALKPKSY